MPVFGKGTVTFGTVPESFEMEVAGGSITHAYDDKETKAMLGHSAKPAPVKQKGPDTLKLDLVNDLTSSGYYAMAYANELTESPVVFTPNTADGASWSGTVVILLPEEIGASEWGADIESSLELPFVGPAIFEPSTVTP